MGRPKGTEDAALAELVRASCLDNKISLSQIAQGIGVAPSTLTRALRSQRFSRKLRSDLDRYLGRKTLPEHPVGSAQIELLHKALQITLEMRSLMPDLQEQLEAALDLQRRLGQTAR